MVKGCCLRNVRVILTVTHILEAALMMLMIFATFLEIEAISYKIPLVYSTSEAARTKRSISSNPTRQDNLRGKLGQGYYIAVDIGKPPQRLNVLIDTGSSNFAAASIANPLIEKYFHPNQSTTFRYNGTRIYVPYTQGNWEGTVASDIISIPNTYGLSVRAEIVCITKSENFFISGSNWQGILGLAYPAIARPDSLMTPFLDELFTVKLVSQVFSLQLCGETNNTDTIGGTMIIGGTDRSLFSGQILYAPLRREWYYEIVLAGLSVGDVPVKIDCKELNTDKTIVDSGTTNLRLPQKVFAVVVEMLKRQLNLHDLEIFEDFWSGTRVICSISGMILTDIFPHLKISIAHSHNDTFILSIPPQQYLIKVSTSLSSFKTNDCFKYAISPSNSGTVLGTVIMEGFYLIFDRQNKRIGFAQSTCVGHNYDRNVRSHLLGPFPSKSDPMQCSYLPPPTTTGSETLVFVAYGMAALCCLSLIPMWILIVKWSLAVKKLRSPDDSADVDTLFEEDK